MRLDTETYRLWLAYKHLLKLVFNFILDNLSFYIEFL